MLSCSFTFFHNPVPVTGRQDANAVCGPAPGWRDAAGRMRQAQDAGCRMRQAQDAVTQGMAARSRVAMTIIEKKLF